MGFISAARDPARLRGEFQGFVGILNPETSKKIKILINRGPQFLAKLPWPKEFEKDEFDCKDFAVLNLLACPGSKIGNSYSEITQKKKRTLHFPNLTFAFGDEQEGLSFLSPADKALIVKYFVKSEELQVGLRALGSGSGKLFRKGGDGTFNFPKGTLDPLTGKPVKYYGSRQSFEQTFCFCYKTLEDCRVKGVGWILVCDEEILKIFGFEGEEAKHVKVAHWLHGVVSGLLSLKWFSLDERNLKSLDDIAGFVILRVLVEAGADFITIQEVANSEDGKPDLRITMDPTKIDTVGRPALDQFLLKLQVYKSTANYLAAQQMLLNYSEVDEVWIRRREIVMERQKPRPLKILPNTIIEEGADEPIIKSYPPTVEGFIESWIQRFTGDEEQLIYDEFFSWVEKEKVLFNMHDLQN